MREFLLLALASLALAPPLPAQEAPPAPKVSGVQITFLPPPMEGTLSLGVFTKAGKLVRTLKREAVVEKDFTLGLNGLITQWDGKDDAGHTVPPGSLRAARLCRRSARSEWRGLPWQRLDHLPTKRRTSPASRKLPCSRASGCRFLAKPPTARRSPSKRVSMAGRLPRKARAPTTCCRSKPPCSPACNPATSPIEQGHLKPATPDASAAPLPELHQPVDYATGRGGTLWLIDRSAAAGGSAAVLCER